MDREIIDVEYEVTDAATDADATSDEYPLRTDHLNKGDHVPVADIEQAFGVKHGSDAFRFKVMAVQRYIEQRFADRGESVTTRSDDKLGVLILTDEDALVYNAKRFETETRQRNRCYLRLAQIDRGQLSDTSQASLDRKVVELGQRVQSDRKVRRDLTATPRERTTPVLLAKKG